MQTDECICINQSITAIQASKTARTSKIFKSAYYLLNYMMKIVNRELIMCMIYENVDSPIYREELQMHVAHYALA